MIEDDDIDGLAAEYVLGSLEVQERKEVADRRRSDVALDQAIKAWEARLGSLSDPIPGIEPPRHVFQRITDRLSALEGQPIAPARTPPRRLAFIVGGCALAACLVLAILWLRHLPASIPTTLSAQLQRSVAGAVLEDGPNEWTPFRFEVSFDLRASTIAVIPIAAGQSSTRHYQLWLIPRDRRGPPISLGVIALPKATTAPWPATYPPADLLNTTVAVSLEPKGGSPIGMPSGPLVFVGKLSQAMP